MPRPNKDGYQIIAAGEVGEYTVCPEAWRLKMLEKLKTAQTESALKGDKLHSAWASNYDDVVYIARSLRLVLILLAIMIFAAYFL